ncbi:DUF4418 family protein [Facklamia sp. DSM 111018]|uniref:DUF4418 family protein n=1 Tax=Facklamia lactis TaxID=2749967 RepID=A0ABS0LPG1_9LACT|nr:DUF4418 family protein [Facklamia lactis]MBG9980242.1 DUF4418 family protein [Facklamia lactis]MBG9986045.1 DUF4418 family protein [Facklamia lactis]
MKKYKWVGMVTLVIGILLLIALFTFAVPCTAAEGEKPMKCYWTHQAMKGIAMVVGGIGIGQILQKYFVGIKALAWANLLVSILGIALVTFLIGTCMKEQMICNLYLKPTGLIVMGINAIMSMIVLLMKDQSPSYID